MYNLQDFLDEMSNTTGIKFNLISDDGSEIFIGYTDTKCCDVARTVINIGRQQAYLDVPREYETCTSLLKYTIENWCKDVLTDRMSIIADILDGKDVRIDKIEKNLAFLKSGCTLLLLSVDCNYNEALTIIDQIYNEQNFASIIYGNNIIIIGSFDEVEEHAKSIKESIVSNLYCSCSISFGSIFYDITGLKKAYKDAKECMMLGNRFGIKEDVYSYGRMLFEKIVYNISNEVKKELMEEFRDKFNVFDKEIIITIEEFVNCGLNISDAARKLYIHRNTLIYRLDKITKETGFDIRNFKEATVFIIAFLVWKESNI